jgi:hypothetical protein
MEMSVKVVSAPACYGSSLGQVLNYYSRKCFFMEMGVKGVSAPA